MLRARIVDADGRAIRRSDIVAIQYWFDELDSLRPGVGLAAAGHAGVFLQVADVIHDSPQLDELWTVDDMGFNFQHELAAGPQGRFPRAGQAYRVCYELTPAIGPKSIVRFRWKECTT